MTLKIVSLGGTKGPIDCDSVHLPLSDDHEGKGGGSYGIREGHIKSLLSLGKGSITAYLEGQDVFSAVTEGGFATVEDDVITVVTEKCN